MANDPDDVSRALTRLKMAVNLLAFVSIVATITILIVVTYALGQR